MTRRYFHCGFVAKLTPHGKLHAAHVSQLGLGVAHWTQCTSSDQEESY